MVVSRVLLSEAGPELGMERTIASLLISLPLIAFAAASLAELTLIVSLSRTPVRVIHWPANWPICQSSPTNSYSLSPLTIAYLEPLRTHILAQADAFFSESSCVEPQCASVTIPEKFWPGTSGST